jgi:xanthine/uracil permease
MFCFFWSQIMGEQVPTFILSYSFAFMTITQVHGRSWDLSIYFIFGGVLIFLCFFPILHPFFFFFLDWCPPKIL